MSNQNGGDAVTTGIVTQQQVTSTEIPSDSPTSLGFCHSCNKQTQINIERFNCSECNGGFIELFNLEESSRINASSSQVPRTDTTTENEQRSSSENSNSTNPSFFLINPDSQTERGEEFSPLTTPLFQLIRRLNNRRVRATNIVNSEFPNEATNNSESSLETDSDSNSASNSTQANSSAPGTSFNHFNRHRHSSSFHYRLRRHAHGSSSSSTSLSNRDPERCRIPIHRHRFHRNLRFHFNSLEDDEILNDHGAIIITTLINQLRNTNRGAAPASDTQIQSLPIINIDQTLVEKISQCAVCMEDFLLNESAKQLPCKHLYHDPCIDQWLKLHATCPVCRKNISGAEPSEEATESSDIPRPTFLNIFPLNGSNQTINLNQNDLESATSSTTNNLTQPQRTLNTSTSRRQPIRNRHLYRIQIRQALNNASSNLPQAMLNQEATDNANLSENERDIRNRRLGDTVAQSMAMQERDTGVRATALLINPQWNQSSESEPFASSNLTSNAQNSTNESNHSTSNDDSNTETTESTAGGNSRISQMMDRFFSRFRTNRFSHEANDSVNVTTSVSMNNQSESSEQQPTASSRPAPPRSISIRLGNLLRSSSTQNSNTSSSENDTEAQETDSNNTNNRSRDSSFYEIFRLNSNPDVVSRQSFGPNHRTSLRLPASLRSTSRAATHQRASTEPSTSIESFTENPNNYFDFSLFNRSQVSENNLLLDRLFDIPEDSQQISPDDLNEHLLGDNTSSDEGVPELVSSEEPMMISDEPDFHHRANPTLSSTSGRRTSLNELENSELACSSGIPQAKKRKTEST